MKDILIKNDNDGQLIFFDSSNKLDNLNLDDGYIDVSILKLNKKYKCVKLFAGAGGLALGLEKAGFDALSLIEIDKYACNNLIHNRQKWNVIHDDIINVFEKGI